MCQTETGKEPVVLTVAEAAKLCRISRSVAYEQIRRGRILAIRVSERRLVVPRDALMKLLAGQAQQTLEGDQYGR